MRVPVTVLTFDARLEMIVYGPVSVTGLVAPKLVVAPFDLAVRELLTDPDRNTTELANETAPVSVTESTISPVVALIADEHVS